jgi:hypothetical protein
MWDAATVPTQITIKHPIKTAGIKKVLFIAAPVWQ